MSNTVTVLHKLIAITEVQVQESIDAQQLIFGHNYFNIWLS